MTTAARSGAPGIGASQPASAAGVIVLGSGRSGTSAITRALVSAGFFAGRDEELYGPDRGNPLGHYEPLSILEVNEELLEERFDCSWWADSPPPEEQLRHRAQLAPRLSAILDALIASADGAPVAVKEPRINGLLPLWGPVIESVLHPVLALRHPLEIALSHAERDGTSVNHALASWEALTTVVLDWLDGRTATVAPYERIMSDHGLVGEIVDEARSQLEPGCANRVRPGDAGSALRSELHRQRAGELDQAEFLSDRQTALWDYLRTLPAGNVRLQVPDRLRQPATAARMAMRCESERVRLAQAHAHLVAKYFEATERVAELERDSALAESYRPSQR